MKRSAYPVIVDLPKPGEGGELASGGQPQERRGAGDQVLPQPRRGRLGYRAIQMKQKHRPSCRRIEYHWVLLALFA